MFEKLESIMKLKFGSEPGKFFIDLFGPFENLNKRTRFQTRAGTNLREFEIER